MIDEIKNRHQYEKEVGSIQGYIDESQCFDDREWLIKEVDRLQEREFNHYPIEIEELESRIFKLTDDLEVAHDALEMLPPKEIEISERTQFKINETVSKLLSEKLKNKLEIAIQAFEHICEVEMDSAEFEKDLMFNIARDALKLLK